MFRTGKLLKSGVVVERREIKQSELTSECWTIQFQGLSACTSCEVKDTDECGGKRIRETLMNSKRKSVPLGREI